MPCIHLRTTYLHIWRLMNFSEKLKIDGSFMKLKTLEMLMFYNNCAPLQVEKYLS